MIGSLLTWRFFTFILQACLHWYIFLSYHLTEIWWLILWSLLFMDLLSIMFVSTTLCTHGLHEDMLALYSHKMNSSVVQPKYNIHMKHTRNSRPSCCKFCRLPTTHLCLWNDAQVGVSISSASGRCKIYSSAGSPTQFFSLQLMPSPLSPESPLEAV